MNMKLALLDLKFFIAQEFANLQEEEEEAKFKRTIPFHLGDMGVINPTAGLDVTLKMRRWVSPIIRREFNLMPSRAIIVREPEGQTPGALSLFFTDEKNADQFVRVYNNNRIRMRPTISV
jgi:hypothetical protein